MARHVPYHRSMKTGLMLPISERSDGTIPSFAELRELALRAETDGLDSIWLADHLLFREDGETTGIHEAWTTITALAALTVRVELGTLVLAMPFRNPALLAKMAVALDEVSGGRLILGVGCGWHEPEFDAFGYPFDHRVSRFEEALAVMMPLLREGRAEVRGRYHSAADAVLAPSGPRPGGIPVLIAGKQPRMLGLVAKHADAWNAAWYGRADESPELEERLARLDSALAEAGRDPATLDITVGIFVAFPELGGVEDAPERAIRGSVEEVANGLRGYADRGVKHVIAHFWPPTPEAVGLLAQAAAMAGTKAPARA